MPDTISPKVEKAAIVWIPVDQPRAKAIVFQYNPETLTRRLDVRAWGGSEGGGERSEVLRLMAPPTETISLKIELDATDRLEKEDQVAVRTGLHPVLAALELLIYPTSQSILRDIAQANAGSIEIVPPEAPLLLFVWGKNRVVPVRLTGLNIAEQAYDPQLNPIHAEVDLTLTVLTSYDLRPGSKAHGIYMAYQTSKEVLSETAIQPANDVGAAVQFI